MTDETWKTSNGDGVGRGSRAELTVTLESEIFKGIKNNARRSVTCVFYGLDM